MEIHKNPLRIFYGWWIVGACFFIALYTGGVIYYGFTAIIEPIVNEFGWSYTQVSLATSLRGMEVGLGAPVVGWFVDRYGARPVLFTGSIIIGLGLILLGRINTLLAFYLVYGLISVGSTICGNTAIMAAVAKWFHRKVSMAIGITICGFGASGFMVPVIVKLVDTYGWQTAITILGFGVFAITVPLTLVVRSRPEQYGYLPDGVKNNIVSENENVAPVTQVNSDTSAKQALKTRAFWYIAFVFSNQWMVASAIITHIMPYLSSHGIPRATSALAASAIPITSILGRSSFGWLGDKMNKKQLTAIGFILMTLGVLLFTLISVDNTWVILLSIIPFGIGFGGLNTMKGVLLREYYGRERFATILGFVTEVGVIGSVAGAPIAGYVFDTWHNYQPIWLIYAGLTFISLIAISTMPPVKKADI